MSLCVVSWNAVISDANSILSVVLLLTLLVLLFSVPDLLSMKDSMNDNRSVKTR